MLNRREFVSQLLVASGAALAGCSQAEEAAEKKVHPGSRVAVVVYSYTGNTLTVAETIARLTKGTLLRLEPQKAYPEDYTTCTKVAKEELAKGVLPALKPYTLSPDAYDVLFVGSPNWWGTVAPPVRTFLKEAAFTRGKQVVPFFTHGGGGMQQCEKDLVALTPEAEAHLSGKTFSGYRAKRAEKEISAWLATLGF